MRWPERGEVYRHYAGDSYVVHGIAVCHDGIRHVVYGHVSDANDPAMLFVQPVGRFTQVIDAGGQKHVPRFDYEGRRVAI